MHWAWGNCIGFQNQHLWTLSLMHLQLPVVLSDRVNVALVEQGSNMITTIAPIGTYCLLSMQMTTWLSLLCLEELTLHHAQGKKTPAGYCMVPPFLFTQSLLLYTVFNDFVHLTVWDVVINGQLAPNIAIQLFHLDVWLGTSGTAHSFKVSKTR